MVKLVEEQPADMDRTTWKEKRRDAAKRLGTIRDKRSVATLAKVAETETFDIIGEIAIQGLGQLGDPSAVPVLQRIAAANRMTRDWTRCMPRM
ncbi:MAG: HEAT repeat domain-containing protein [Gammaproteobacteria bacterium]|nr:HEAT repeat domain-containing protein [Gammaproteobacteria bacterium]